MAKGKKKNRTPKNKRPTVMPTGDWAPVFLATLANSGNVRFSCMQAKIGRRTAYDRREADPEFKDQWDTALAEAVDMLEGVAWSRAKAVSDTLLIFLLKSHRPKMYRELHRHEHAGDPQQPLKLAVTITSKIDEYAAAFASAADREEAGGPASDGAGESVGS